MAGREDAAAEEEAAIDLETYKKQLAERRANLPNFVASAAAAKPLETEKELEAQGYVRLQRGPEGEGDGIGEEGAEVREDRPKKKSVNLYEYVQNEGGRLPSFGRRGGRNNAARGGRDDKEKRQRQPRIHRETAPDLRDTQAFPTLGAR